jgi:hypothetical protein
MDITPKIAKARRRIRTRHQDITRLSDTCSGDSSVFTSRWPVTGHNPKPKLPHLNISQDETSLTTSVLLGKAKLSLTPTTSLHTKPLNLKLAKTAEKVSVVAHMGGLSLSPNALWLAPAELLYLPLPFPKNLRMD